MRRLNQLALKINPKKSMATLLPKNSKIKRPEIENQPIPIHKNLRVLGHYPWNDGTVTNDIEERITKFELSLK